MEIGNQVVVALQANPVMARGIALFFRGPRRFQRHSLDRAKDAGRKDPAVRVHDADVARRAVRHLAHGHRVETEFGKMPFIGRIGEFEAEIFHPALAHAGANSRTCAFHAGLTSKRSGRSKCSVRPSTFVTRQAISARPFLRPVVSPGSPP